MLSAYFVTSRWRRDIEASTWFGVPKLSSPERFELHRAAPLADSWKRDAQISPVDAVIVDIQWFAYGLIMVPIDGADPDLFKILSTNAEWLPLGGQAEGWQVHHSLHKTLLNEKLVERGPTVIEKFPGPVLKWSFDKTTIVPNSIVHFTGLGLVMFEHDETPGLRAIVHERDIRGIGFVKIWDETETWELEPNWRPNLLRREDLWC